MKIEDLKNIDFKKIPDTYKGLTAGIKSLLTDYEKEADKAYFEHEATENIKQYLEMVRSVAPEALKASKGTSNSSKTHTYKDGFQWQLLSKETAKEFFEMKKEVFGLDLDQETEALIESDKDLGTFDHFGVAVKKKKTVEKTKVKKGIPLRTIAYGVADALSDLAVDLEGEDETIIATTRLALDDAIALQEDSKFIKAIQVILESHNDWKDDISDKNILEYANAEIQKLSDALKPLKKLESEKIEKSKKVIEKVKGYEKDIEACRTVIREFNRKKKADQPDKPKLTRRTVLKNRVLAIVKLTPESLVGNPAVQDENRKIVKATIKAFMKNWGMTSFKQAENAVDKVLDAVEDKAAEKESKVSAQKWSQAVPNTEQIIAYEKKHNKLLLHEAAAQIVVHIIEAIKQYKTDKKAAFKYLSKHLDANQLKEYLPKYILEELADEKTIDLNPTQS